MKILRRHFIREFLKVFCTISAGLSLIFSLLELIDKITDFMPHRPESRDLLLYTALNVPQYILYLMPMSALLSGLFVFGQAERARETLAVRASGGSLKALLKPFIFLGLLLSLTGFLLGEFIVPDFSEKAHHLRDILMKKGSAATLKEGTLWFRAQDSIVKIDLSLPDQGIIKGVSIFRLRDDLLVERIDADSGEWVPLLGESSSKAPRISQGREEQESVQRGAWRLRGVTVHDIAKGAITRQGELLTEVIDRPDIFARGVKKPDEMNVRELIAYGNKLREAGFRNIRIQVDIHSKISYPLINIIMLILGIALATQGLTGGGLATAATGIAISLTYWFGYTALLSLGYAGMIPAFLSAWVMPVLFGWGSFHLFRKIPE